MARFKRAKKGRVLMRKKMRKKLFSEGRRRYAHWFSRLLLASITTLKLIATGSKSPCSWESSASAGAGEVEGEAKGCRREEGEEGRWFLWERE
jgi:hypothetical protein